ncbi:MAG TPA: choice-of-anchor P family protein [Polyangiaceae bacterium]
MTTRWSKAGTALLVLGTLMLAGCEGDDDYGNAAAVAQANDDGGTSSSPTTYADGGLSGNHEGTCRPAPTSPRLESPSCAAAGGARARIAGGQVLGLAALSIDDTGVVNSSPGKTLTLASATSPGLLSTGAVTSSASSSSSGATAATSITGLNLSVLGIGITADAVQTTAAAACGAGKGSTKIANLKIAGVAVDTSASSTIEVKGILKVVIDEETPIANGITVNALHVTALAGGADVAIGTATAYTTCACSNAGPSDDAGATDAGDDDDASIDAGTPDGGESSDAGDGGEADAGTDDDAGAAADSGTDDGGTQPVPCDDDHLCASGFVCVPNE